MRTPSKFLDEKRGLTYERAVIERIVEAFTIADGIAESILEKDGNAFDDMLALALSLVGLCKQAKLDPQAIFDEVLHLGHQVDVMKAVRGQKETVKA